MILSQTRYFNFLIQFIDFYRKNMYAPCSFVFIFVVKEVKMNGLNNISVIDGRYKKQVLELNDIFSEYGLIKHRVDVEIKWLLFILNDLQFCPLSKDETASVLSISEGFNKESAVLVKNIEKTTNHDVKAVEYYVKNELQNRKLDKIKEWVHFCCTSEDINNISYALMFKSGIEIILKYISELLEVLESFGEKYKGTPMMSRTHGQPATPTTVGKEFINFAFRILREKKLLEKIHMECKINGASGNFNAHFFVKPEINWIDASEKFITEKLEMKPLIWTTQINNYHYISEVLHSLIRISSTVIDIDRDFWGYISFNYFKQKTKEGEVGSSTMPHKVNPIDFENSEGNIGIAISIMEHMSVKLLNSRFQRDLTDSTVLRNSGIVFGYIVIGLKSSIKGLSKIEINISKISGDLSDNLELLAEPVQTAMRMYGEENPYEKLKLLTRGHKISQKDLNNLIDGLEKVPEDVKIKMKSLTPEKYIGLSEKLVERYFSSK